MSRDLQELEQSIPTSSNLKKQSRYFESINNLESQFLIPPMSPELSISASLPVTPSKIFVKPENLHSSNNSSPNKSQLTGYSPTIRTRKSIAVDTPVLVNSEISDSLTPKYSPTIKSPRYRNYKSGTPQSPQTVQNFSTPIRSECSSNSFIDISQKTPLSNGPSKTKQKTFNNSLGLQSTPNYNYKPNTPTLPSRSPFFGGSPLMKTRTSAKDQISTPFPKEKALTTLSPVSTLSSPFASVFTKSWDDLPSGTDTINSFFKQPMASPTNESFTQSPNVDTNIFNQTIMSEISSPMKQTVSKHCTVTDDSLPLALRIIFDSRLSDNTHDFSDFTNASYLEFWHLTEDEGLIFKSWNELEFDRQNLIFELFQNLKKIRYNMSRMVNVYGPQFKNATGVVGFSDEDYNKTFGVLEEFYHYLDKLLVKKLKPLFDDQMLVNDYEILKLLKNWFNQLKDKYRHISGSVVYLAKLTSNELIKDWIKEISGVQDIEALSNRSAVSPLELFSSYFLKLFTSIKLIYVELKKKYEKLNEEDRLELVNQLIESVDEINKISDTTTDLERKISFNEKLSYKTEIDYSHMEMVDMFSINRKTRELMPLEMKQSITWDDSVLALFDNYLVPLTVKNNYLSNKNIEYFLSKTPIPLQYLQINYEVDGDYKILTVKDVGNKTIHQFRHINDPTSMVLDTFVKDLKKYKNEFWKKINKTYELKVIDANTFIAQPTDHGIFNVEPVSLLLDPLHFALARSKQPTGPVSTELTNVLSADYYTRKRVDLPVEKLFVLGTTYGIFMGRGNTPGSWKKVHCLTNIKKLNILENQVLLCLSGDSLYRISVDVLYESYISNGNPCDINMFDENLRRVTDYELGYQTIRKGSGSTFLFTWKDKKIKYTTLSKMDHWKFQWKVFKTQHNILKLQTVYANNFAVAHMIDDSTIWNISKLADIRYSSLNDLEVKSILKGEKPVAIFPLPNKLRNISEVLVVYSKFCVRMKNDKGKYKQSTEEIVWFGMRCFEAAFDPDQRILVVVGEQSLEIFSLFEEKNKKTELIGCVIGKNVKMLNKMPGKVMLSMMNVDGDEEYKTQAIVKLRRLKLSL